MDWLTPHYRDWFAGYRFAPYRVAVGDRGVWVADRSLPIFGYVDLRSGVIGEPISAQAALGSQFETWGLEFDAELLYVLGQRGLFAVDQERGTAVWERPDARSELVVRGDRVWTSIDSDIAELDRFGHVMGRYGLPGHNSRSCAPRDGWVAVAATPERQIMPVRVARFEVGASIPTWTAELHGTGGGGQRQLYASQDAVWVMRRTPWQEGEIRQYLCALDAATGELVSELQVDLSGRIMLHQGLAWSWSQVADEKGRPLRRSVTIFDPRTGDVRVRHDLGTGNAPSPSAGGAGIWCTVWNNAPFLVGMSSADSDVRSLSLRTVDASHFRPSPPPRITAPEAESAALQTIRADMRLSPNGERHPDEASGPFGPDIDIEALALEDKFPDTRLVLYFRSRNLPDRLFARSTRLWDDFGTFENDYYLRFTAHMHETLHACGGWLPATRTPDETGVIWI